MALSACETGAHDKLRGLRCQQRSVGDHEMMVWLGLAVLVWLLVVASVLHYACRWPRYPVNADAWPWRERRLGKSLDQLTDETLASMTLSEKVAQLSGDGGPQFMVRLGINVLVLGRFPNTYAGRNACLQVPPFSFCDGPRGVVIGKRATCFPVAMARAASWDIALEQRVGDAIGKEVRAVGANYFGGLCINLLRHPAWGRAQECYGEDPYLTGAMAVALLQTVQRHHVMACAKHFAVNSIENSRFYVDVQVDKRTLHEVYLPHFKQCVDAGVASLMSAYNQLNGEYCGHHEYLLNKVLRQQWGFKGFVSSDWLWGIYETRKPVLAGMDVEMPYARHFGSKLIKAIQRGEIDETLVDRNARRVLRTKLDFISRADHQTYDAALLACDNHRALAQEVAEKSMVLLKNDQQLLPLNKSAVKTIAIIGELAAIANIGDHGSSRVTPPYVITLLDGLQQYVAKHSLPVAFYFDEGKNLPKACDVAHAADVVILVAGYRHNDEGENLASNHKPGGKHKPAIGGDRPSLSLHQPEIEMILQVSAANANTLVTLIGGSAIITSEWDEKVRAILMAWYPGMEGGHAFARVVFGDVNPSGKLPFSIPRQQDDLVPFGPFAETAKYGYYHGYTYFDKMRKDPAAGALLAAPIAVPEPAYPFGFGLGYTRFQYRMLTLNTQQLNISSKGEQETLTVGVQVKNTGAVEGEEVVQLYIGFDTVARSTGIERHHKLLRGFRKIKLAAGEDAIASLEISAQDLKRFDPVTETWALDKGEYVVMVGPSSDERVLLKENFAVI
jgi:beta-glucosidase